MPFTVYALFDEREPEAVRYIGFSRNPETRCRHHLCEAGRPQTSKSHRLNWIRKVTTEGARVLWRTLSVVETADQAAALEIVFIRDHVAAGCRLVNGTIGGEGVQGMGGVLAPEALARRNETLNSSAYIERRSAQSAAYWAAGTTREQQRQAMKAFWATPEGQAKRAELAELTRGKKTGYRYSEASREKMRQAKLGKPGVPRTEAWKQKIRDAQKGIKRGPMSPEQKAAHTAALRSPETRERMRQSALARKRKPDVDVES